MLKHIKAKGGKMKITPKHLFNNMTDDDFMFIHHAGRLKEFCTALTLDLQPMTDDEEFQA